MKREITSIDFGDWMKLKRKEKHMTQMGLANVSGVHYNSIGRWERGEDYPTLDMAEQIVKALGAEIVIRET